MSHAELLTDDSVARALRQEIDDLRARLAAYQAFYIAHSYKQGVPLRKRAQLIKEAREKIESQDD